MNQFRNVVVSKNILIKPITTEKTEKLSNPKTGNRTYAFKVNMDANKIEITNAVAEKFSVEVEDVRTVIVRGKRKSRYTKQGFIQGKRSNYKKAYVTLANGQEIDMFKNA